MVLKAGFIAGWLIYDKYEKELKDLGKNLKEDFNRAKQDVVNAKDEAVSNFRDSVNDVVKNTI